MGCIIKCKTLSTNRGFTEHEHIEETDLINMNARLYDPTIARFISADSIIPDMYDTQSFNRYSYVKNNPLKYVDPSGHSWFSDAWKSAGSWIKDSWRTIVTVVVVIVVTYFTFGWGAILAKSWGLIGSYSMSAIGASSITTMTATLSTGGSVLAGSIAGAAAGFAGGAVGTLLNGGTWSKALSTGLKGAAAGAIMGGIGGLGWSAGKVVLSGIGGGASSEIMGGDFSDGFKIGIVVAAAGYLYNNMTGYDSTLKPAEEYSKGEYHKYYYDPELGFTPEQGNTIGFDSQFTKGTNWYHYSNVFKHGGLISRFANIFPGMNSFSKFHDQIFVGGHLNQNILTNIPSMVPALAINYASIYGQNYIAFEIARDIEGDYK